MATVGQPKSIVDDDNDKLTAEEKRHFKTAVKKFNDDLERGRFRKGLRVKSVEGAPGVWEMTWGDDGRATFQYGKSMMSGKKHRRGRRARTFNERPLGGSRSNIGQVAEDLG